MSVDGSSSRLEITEELLIRGRRELEHAKQMRQPWPLFYFQNKRKDKIGNYPKESRLTFTT